MEIDGFDETGNSFCTTITNLKAIEKSGAGYCDGII
jgi:hypothetical protein